MPSSQRVGTDSDQYSISNATSFESFYHIREKTDSEMEDILDGVEFEKEADEGKTAPNAEGARLRDAAKNALNFRFLPQHRFVKMKRASKVEIDESFEESKTITQRKNQRKLSPIKGCHPTPAQYQHIKSRYLQPTVASKNHRKLQESNKNTFKKVSTALRFAQRMSPKRKLTFSSPPK